MEKIKIHNLEGQEVDSLSLEENISSLKFNPSLAHEITTILKNNSRIDKAKTKSKAEVSGGGKKPWKQKGTGRARAGSNRSPIWRGGGVTFGPRGERNFVKKINAKTAKLFFGMSLKKKIESQEFFIIESWEKTTPKTKDFKTILSGLKLDKGSIAIVDSGKNANLKKATGNLPNVELKSAAGINSLDFYLFKNILVDKKAFADLNQRLKSI